MMKPLYLKIQTVKISSWKNYAVQGLFKIQADRPEKQFTCTNRKDIVIE